MEYSKRDALREARREKLLRQGQDRLSKITNLYASSSETPTTESSDLAPQNNVAPSVVASAGKAPPPKNQTKPVSQAPEESSSFQTAETAARSRQRLTAESIAVPISRPPISHEPTTPSKSAQDLPLADYNDPFLEELIEKMRSSSGTDAPAAGNAPAKFPVTTKAAGTNDAEFESSLWRFWPILRSLVVAFLGLFFVYELLASDVDVPSDDDHDLNSVPSIARKLVFISSSMNGVEDAGGFTVAGRTISAWGIFVALEVGLQIIRFMYRPVASIKNEDIVPIMGLASQFGISSPAVVYHYGRVMYDLSAIWRSLVDDVSVFVFVYGSCVVLASLGMES